MTMLLLALLLAAPEAPQPSAEPARRQLVCKRVTPSTGSHIKVARKCRSAAEWAASESAGEGPGMALPTRAPQPEPGARPRRQ